MADIKTAIDFVLRQEDAKLPGVITDRPSDLGGLTRFGLCAKWHPELVEAGFYAYQIVDGKQVAQMPEEEALALAEKTYATAYEPSLQLAEIASIGIATAILSFAVLEGQQEAVKLLQEALSINSDGLMGPATLAAENSANPATLLPKLVNLQRQHFAAIAAANPSQEANLNGWDNRADALLALA